MKKDDKSVVDAISKVLSIAIFECHPSFVYRVRTGNMAGSMAETSLSQIFIAETYKEAVDIGVNWTNNRYKNVYQDFYDECEIGCLKINVRFIGRSDEKGQIDTKRGMTFFEWKYDWGYDLDSAVKEFARKRFADTHPMQGE
jgi:hypothetical protein